MTSTNTRLIYTFCTRNDMNRTMTISNPRPLQQLNANNVLSSASYIVASNVFDASVTGVIQSLTRAVHEQVETSVLF